MIYAFINQEKNIKNVAKGFYFMKYKNKISTIGRGNKLSLWSDSEGNSFNKLEIIKSWEISYKEKVSRNEGENGLRIPQFGALSAIRAHLATSNSPATIVLPTGERVIIVMGTICVIKSRVSGTLNRYISCTA